MEWFNYYGLIFVAVIMIPNVIFAATNKDGFKNLYKNETAEKAEKVGINLGLRIGVGDFSARKFREKVAVFVRNAVGIVFDLRNFIA